MRSSLAGCFPWSDPDFFVKRRRARLLPRQRRDPAAAAALLRTQPTASCAGSSSRSYAWRPRSLPRSRALLRADGRSIYRRHGGVRYATRAQLSMDDVLVAQAGAEGAPRLTRAAAAQLLRADPERLAASLEGHAADAAPAGTWLREDQAAAALSPNWPANDRLAAQARGHGAAPAAEGRSEPDEQLSGESSPSHALQLSCARRARTTDR